jgi:F-type H+-transporting ATPase subunit epsilon
MAVDKIDLEIVTPKGKALAASVDEVTAPSVHGEFGVLAGHLPLVAATRTGLVSYRQGTETKRVAIGPGFAEAGQTKVVIVAEDFADPSMIDPVIVRRDLAEVQAKIEKSLAQVDASDDVVAERKILIEKENWLATLLELHGEPRPATVRPVEAYATQARAEPLPVTDASSGDAS